MTDQGTWTNAAQWFVCLSLAMGFFSAVAIRFGWWALLEHQGCLGSLGSVRRSGSSEQRFSRAFGPKGTMRQRVFSLLMTVSRQPNQR